MAGATLTTMNSALKRLYLPRLRSTLQTKTVLRSQLESSTEHTNATGLQADVPVNIRGNQGIGARAEGGALPTPQNQVYVTSTVGYAYNYARIRVTHPVIAASKDDRGAWVKVVNAEMTGLERDFGQDRNRQDFGYGYGVLAVVSALADNGVTGTVTVNSTQYLRVGMVFDTNDGLNQTSKTADSHVILTIPSSTTFTCDNGAGDFTASIAANDYVFREDAATYESMGLLGIIDDDSNQLAAYITTLQSISRATYPEWNSNVFSNDTANTAREITPAILDDSLLTVAEKGDGNVGFGITSRIQFRKIANLIVPDRRYTDTMELKGGFKSIMWSGTPIVWDKDCPVDAYGNDVLFWVDPSHLQRYQLSEMDWDDTDGNVLHRNEGYATYDATLFEYDNLGTDRPNAHGAIRDLSRS